MTNYWTVSRYGQNPRGNSTKVFDSKSEAVEWATRSLAPGEEVIYIENAATGEWARLDTPDDIEWNLEDQ